MLDQSRNEYAFLKKEISDIKSCITRYNLYIIGVTGLSGLVFKYIMMGPGANNPEYSIILIFLTLVTISSLFEIVWYKCSSHNRHVGYLQLLSQETNHYCKETASQFNDPEEKKRVQLHVDNKHYLDRPTPLNWKDKKEDKPDIYTWEYVMNRLNNRPKPQRPFIPFKLLWAKKWGLKLVKTHGRKESNKRLEALLSSTGKSQFRFELPSDLKYCLFENSHDGFVGLDSEFFRMVVYPQFIAKISWYLLPFHIIRNGVSLFRKDWSLRAARRIKTSNRSERKSPNKEDGHLYHKFISNGWQYPAAILKICLAQVALLLIAFALVWEDKYSFVWSLSEAKAIPTIVSIGIMLIVLLWGFRYLRKIDGMMVGQNSIDYFCWSFFIYRAQILNSTGIMPGYFSKGFVRFFKAKFTATYANDILGNPQSIQSCSICGSLHVDGYNLSDDFYSCVTCKEHYLDFLGKNQKIEPRRFLIKDIFRKDSEKEKHGRQIDFAVMILFHRHVQDKLKQIKIKHQCKCETASNGSVVLD